jgi:hypothetical protein
LTASWKENPVIEIPCAETARELEKKHLAKIAMPEGWRQSHIGSQPGQLAAAALACFLEKGG